MDFSSSASEEEICSLVAMQLASACVHPATLEAAIELDLLELIKKAGHGAFFSPAELAAQIPSANPEAHAVLDRILRLLVANNILNCTVPELPDGGVERLYSLAPVCQYLTRSENGVSLAPQLLMNNDKIFSETWYHLKDAVVEGLPSERACGMSLFEYTAINPRANELFNQAMSQDSTLLMNKILQRYKGFDGLKSPVDVGGGTGASTLHDNF